MVSVILAAGVFNSQTKEVKEIKKSLFLQAPQKDEPTKEHTVKHKAKHEAQAQAEAEAKAAALRKEAEAKAQAEAKAAVMHKLKLKQNILLS